MIINPIGARGQVLGGVVMGIGQALSEGMQLDGDGHQLNPHLLDYKLVTAADAPPIEIAFVENAGARRRAERVQGDGRAAVRADAGRGGKRDRARDRPAGPEPADDPRAGLGGDALSASLTVAATVDDAIGALAGGARPVAGGTDLVVGARQGKAPLPEQLVAIHRLDELRSHRCDRQRSPGRRARRPTAEWPPTRSSATG